MPVKPQFSTLRTVAEAGTQTAPEDNMVEVGTQTTTTITIDPV